MSMFLSAFVHLMIMSLLILLTAPVAFDAALPDNIPLFFAALAIYTASCLSIGCVLGLTVKSQAKLPLLAQLLFLPSMMLSEIQNLE